MAKNLKKVHFQEEKKQRLGFYMNHIANPVSYPLFKLLVRTPITGNQISCMILILGLVSPLFIAIGLKRYAIIGCLLLQLAVVLDCIDGSIARYRHQESYMGLYFDYLFHNISVPFLFFGIGVNSYNNSGNIMYIYAGFAIFFLIVLTNMLQAVKHVITITYIIPRKKHKLISNVFKQWEKIHQFSREIKSAKNYLISILTKIMNFLNDFSHIFTIVLIFVLIDMLPYLLLFYLPFYFIIFIIKAAVEFKSGFDQFIVKNK